MSALGEVIHGLLSLSALLVCWPYLPSGSQTDGQNPATCRHKQCRVNIASPMPFSSLEPSWKAAPASPSRSCSFWLKSLWCCCGATCSRYADLLCAWLNPGYSETVARATAGRDCALSELPTSWCKAPSVEEAKSLQLSCAQLSSCTRHQVRWIPQE